jgi:transposase
VLTRGSRMVSSWPERRQRHAARTLKHHLPNLLIYFKHRITNATSEGINRKIQTLKPMACAHRNWEH